MVWLWGRGRRRARRRACHAPRCARRLERRRQLRAARRAGLLLGVRLQGATIQTRSPHTKRRWALVDGAVRARSRRAVGNFATVTSRGPRWHQLHAGARRSGRGGAPEQQLSPREANVQKLHSHGAHRAHRAAARRPAQRRAPNAHVPAPPGGPTARPRLARQCRCAPWRRSAAQFAREPASMPKWAVCVGCIAARTHAPVRTAPSLPRRPRWRRRPGRLTPRACAAWPAARRRRPRPAAA
jgi:hypothetical protein